MEVKENLNELMSSLAGYDVYEKDTTPPVVADEMSDNDQGDGNVTTGQEQQQVTTQEGIINITELPDEMQDYILASRQPDFDKEKYIAEKNKRETLFSMNDRDFYETYLKANYLKTEDNPDGLTEEELAEELTKMSPLQLKTTTTQLRQELRQYFDKEKEARKMAKINYAEFNNKELETLGSQTIERNKDKMEYFGIPLKENEKKEVDEAYKEWIKVKENGKSLLQEHLENDDVLYQVVALLHKGETGVKGKLTEIKESVKESIIKRLGLEPLDTGGGNASSRSTTDFNPNVLI